MKLPTPRLHAERLKFISRQATQRNISHLTGVSAPTLCDSLCYKISVTNSLFVVVTYWRLVVADT